MPRLTEVFIDMDGVLTDFVGTVLKLFNVPDPWETHPHRYRGNYSLAEAIGVTRSQLWRRIDSDPDLWANLPPNPAGLELLSFLEDRFSPNRVYILSSPSLHPHCYRGKAEWISEHIPHIKTRTILTNTKHLIASSKRLLIDDSDRNTHEFRQARGHALLFPQPWNNMHYRSHDPLSYLKTRIKPFTK